MPNYPIGAGYAHAARTAKPVQAYTPEKGLWTGSNNFGVEAPFAPDANNRQTILKLDEYGEPTMWTVSLGVDGINAYSGGVSVTALIDFGVGGTTQRIECDWLEGACISFPANAVNVQAFWEDIQAGETDDARLRVTVSRGGARQTFAQKTITRQFSGAALTQFPTGVIPVAAGGQVLGLQIPKFTRNILVLPQQGSAAELAAFYTANFRAMTTAQASGLAQRNVVRGLELAEGMSLPMTSQARYVRLQNDSGEDLNVILVAELA